MKKIILFSILFFAVDTVFSQKIILHRNSGGNQVLYSSTIDSITFLPFACGDEIRYEGKTYGTVLIGTQCWMKENLDVGTMLQGNTNQSNNGIIEKYCYNNDTANCSLYGGLYQWQEAMKYASIPGAQGICPYGWHIPTPSQFQALKTAVNNDGNSLKAIGQGSGSGTGTNTSGFSALLAGANWTGTFNALTFETYFWQTDSQIICLFAFSPQINTYAFGQNLGFSLRCLKN